MATHHQIKSVVTKPSGQFSQPQARPSNRTPQPQKVESLGDYLSKMNDQERLTFELDRFGHFTVEEGDCWTQTEIDAEWSRLHPPSSSPRSLAFVLNWDFKPASAPEPEPKQEEEVDEQDLCLPLYTSRIPTTQSTGMPYVLNPVPAELRTLQRTKPRSLISKSESPRRTWKLTKKPLKRNTKLYKVNILPFFNLFFH